MQRLTGWLRAKPWLIDCAAITVLALLWALYFWRVLTPNPVDQVSYQEGDFSGQFYAFGSYQARRLLDGEIPLWNPYNNAGHPFLADTQAAVFYPPRFITIVVSHWLGGWSYAALQAEAVAHYLVASLLMYTFVRVTTRSATAGVISALVVTYGGYLTGYPPLQLAVLEAGIWFPLALLGVYRASEQGWPGRAAPGWHPGWLALSSASLGISLLAGHPQTTLLFVYGLMAYMAHRAVRRHIGWLPTVLAVGATVALGFSLAAVQILPGWEYTHYVARSGEGVDWGAGGFPWYDLLTLLVPNVLSMWSPLYAGIGALALAATALWRRSETAPFWGGTAAAALVLALGGSTVVYNIVYLIAPGFTLFRGQERAAFLVTYSIAILAGIGVATLQRAESHDPRSGKILATASGVMWLLAIQAVVAELLTPEVDLFLWARWAFFAAVMMTLTWVTVGVLGKRAHSPWWSIAIAAFVVFDLFSATMGTDLEPISPNERTLGSPLVGEALYDAGLFRVDGWLGLGENYGTLYSLQDIQGTSPLRMTTLAEYDRLPQYRRHELLSVKYVFTDWLQLEVPSTIVATAQIPYPVQLHRISDPTPRAWMTYQAMVTSDDDQALGWLADPSFDPRATVILGENAEFDLPSKPVDGWQVSVRTYKPERIILDVTTPQNGYLVISELDYPGWMATVDGKPTRIWRVDAGLRGLPLPAGVHVIEMHYWPASYRIGRALTLVSAVTLVVAVSIAFAAHYKASHKTEEPL